MGTESGDGTTRAILLVCLAGLLFVTMNSLVKALSTRFDPVMLIWAPGCAVAQSVSMTVTI